MHFLLLKPYKLSGASHEDKEDISNKRPTAYRYGSTPDLQYIRYQGPSFYNEVIY